MIPFLFNCHAIRASSVGLLCCAGACLSLAAGQLRGEDWPQWRGRDRSGISSETEWTHAWPDGGPRVQWRAEVGTGFSSVVVSQGRVFTMGNRENVDYVWCFDAKSGEVIWSHHYDSPLDDRFFEGGPTSTPTVDGDYVYTLGRQGDLYCLETRNGSTVWSKNIAEEVSASVPGWGFASSPIVRGDLLILGVGEGGTVVKKQTGELVWSSGRGEAGYMTPYPLSLDGRTYVLVASGRAYQLVDLETGTLQWKHRWLTTYGCNAADPIVDGKRAFISSGYNRGSSLLELDGQLVKALWSNKEMQNQLNSSVKIGNHVYGFSGNDTGEASLQCIDFNSGKTQWHSSPLALGSLMAAGDRLIILSGDGELVVASANPTQFEPLAHAHIFTSGRCWTTPTLANGRLYCRNASGQLVSLNLENPK